MKQLHIMPLNLIKMGFLQTIKDNKVFYKKDFINGYIYYNPLEENYVWYMKTIIGEYSNDLHLNIKTLDALFIFLKTLDIYVCDFRLPD